MVAGCDLQTFICTESSKCLMRCVPHDIMKSTFPACLGVSMSVHEQAKGSSTQCVEHGAYEPRIISGCVLDIDLLRLDAV